MPQMMPLNWLILFCLFIMIFLLFNIINYFNFSYKNKYFTKKKSSIKYNWKW